MFRNIFVKNVKPTPKTESPAQMLKRVEAEAEAERVRMKLADERRERESRINAERVAALQNDTITAKTESAIKREELFERVINYSPLVIISGLAITGQFGSFSKFLTPTFGAGLAEIVAGLMAFGLELIALFLGLHAMKALRRKDSAAGLLIAATLVAGLVAYLNFDHYRNPDETASIASYAFALFSFIAPFLWRVKIRSDHRDELAQNGEIDKRGLKLPRVMWAMHPIKSYKVYRHAAWTGQRDPELAVKDWEATIKDQPVKVKGATAQDLDMLYALVENLKIDLHETSEKPEITTPQRVAITSGHGSEIEKLMRHPKWNDGVAIFSASVDSGNQMKVSDLAAELGMTNRALAGKIREFVLSGKERDSGDHDGSDLAAETA
jgi:hypothetical protein